MNHLPIDFVEYFKLIDKSLEELSKRQEGKIAKLPSWVLCSRTIHIGLTNDGSGFVMRVTPNGKTGDDSISVTTLSTTKDLMPFFEPGIPNIQLEQLREMPFLSLWNMNFYGDENPLSPAIMEIHDLIGFGSTDSASRKFAINAAKEWAVDLWNKASQGDQKPGSFIQEAKQVFDKFTNMIERKAFLERRVHRFINEHAFLLLPPFRTSYFEHPLYWGKSKEIADFILEREFGFPALLIELESPSHQVFKKNGELTEKANHAREQIGRWVRYIDQNHQSNAVGKFTFLSGSKDRLVVIGRGLERKESMLNTKFTDTMIWTYDLLLEEAKLRWNDEIATQRRIVGLEELRPF
jgi:hypothetical protein